jgi:putative transposase
MLHRDYFPPMVPSGYYHVFNRGNNKENLFYQSKNYGYFLEKYKHYLSPWLDIYAYCLLPNHFHLLVRVKEATVFFKAKEFWKFVKDMPEKDLSGFRNLTGLVSRCEDLSGFQNLTGLASRRDEDPTGFQNLLGLKFEDLNAKQEAEFYKACPAFISEQFRLLFMSYSKAINKQQGRTGSLFQRPFKRLAVKNEMHFGNLVYYINANAQLHDISNDFREYPYSSYSAYISRAATKLERDTVIGWFGSRENLIAAHEQQMDLKVIEYLIIEED